MCVQNASRACVGDLNFHSTQRGVERKVAQYNCTVKEPGKEGGAVDGGRGPNGVPDGADGDVQEDEEERDEEEENRPKCIFNESNISSYRHCAMYGDPHLRTLGGQYHTCRILGAWPFIDNDYLTVQITSEPIGVGEGTSITKVCLPKQEQHKADIQIETDSVAQMGNDKRPSVSNQLTADATEQINKCSAVKSGGW